MAPGSDANRRPTRSIMHPRREFRIGRDVSMPMPFARHRTGRSGRPWRETVTR